MNKAQALIVCDKKPNDLITLKGNVHASTDEWTKIGVSGKWDGHPTGTFTMNEAVFMQMIANYEASTIDIVVDYEHATLWGGEAPAAGWIKKIPVSLKVENGEFFAKIAWTEKAKSHIMAGEYRYLSPVFAPNTIAQSDGSDIGWTLHSVALTNKPFLEELDEVRANTLTQLQHHKEDTPMTEEEKAEMQRLRDENKTLNDEKVALTNKNTDLTEQVKVHKDKEAEATVDAAIAAKKLHPEQKDSALKMCKADPEGFGEMIGKAKPMIQVPGGDMYDNSNSGAGNDVDVVALALKNQ